MGSRGNVCKCLKIHEDVKISRRNERAANSSDTHFFRELRVSGHEVSREIRTFSQPMSAISRETRLSLWGRAVTFENVWKSMKMSKSLAEMRGPLIQATRIFLENYACPVTNFSRNTYVFTANVSYFSRNTPLLMGSRGNVWKCLKIHEDVKISLAEMRGPLIQATRIFLENYACPVTNFSGNTYVFAASVSYFSRNTPLLMGSRGNVWKCLKINEDVKISLAEMRGPLIQATRIFLENYACPVTNFSRNTYVFTANVSYFSRNTPLLMGSRGNVWKCLKIHEDVKISRRNERAANSSDAFF